MEQMRTPMFSTLHTCSFCLAIMAVTRFPPFMTFVVDWFLRRGSPTIEKLDSYFSLLFSSFLIFRPMIFLLDKSMKSRKDGMFVRSWTMAVSLTSWFI